VPTMVLKGGALAVLHYRDMGARPMGDVDVLVPPDHAAEAVALLQDAGWSPDPPAARDLLAVRHAWSFRDGGAGHVDLHWRALAYSREDERELWDAAVPLTLGGTRTSALCAADELLLTVVHGLASNAVSPVRWIPDSVALAPATDWDRFCVMAARHRFSYTAAAALEYLRASFAPEIPQSVLDHLRATPATHGERRLHRAMVGRPHRARRAMLIHWAAYRALRSQRTPGVRRVGFASFLLQRLEIDRLGAVPGFAAGRYRARRRRSAALAMRV
jgi:putative nucleotidyltransferase-like protein